MADARITQAALLVLARGVPCLTRWAQCWKITTVKPRFREQAEQEFEFSNAFLHPWVDPIDLKTPPLNPLNTHLYDVVTIIATGWTDVSSEISQLQQSDWRTGFSTLQDAIDYINSTSSPYTIDPGENYIGYAAANVAYGDGGNYLRTANAIDSPGPLARDADGPNVRLVYARHQVHAVLTSQGMTAAMGSAQNLTLGPYLQGFIDYGQRAYVSGFQVSQHVNLGLIFRRVSTSGGPLGPEDLEDPESGYIVSGSDYWPKYGSAHVVVRRFPGPPTEGAVLVTGNFKVLQQFSESPFTKPLNPCIRDDDPRYNDQSFWENAYAAAVAAGTASSGKTYNATGTGNPASTYPVAQDWAYLILVPAPSTGESGVVVWEPDRVFRFTSHDQPVEFMGETYQPCHSLAASAAELGVVLGNPGGLELSGIIADAGISEADLEAGLFDRARVEVWMVPWEASAGETPFRLAAGIVGNMSQGDQGFVFDVQTPGALLNQQPLLPAYTPGCRWELGSPACGVDMEALTVTGAVTAVAERNATTRAHHRVFWDTNRAEADGYFDLGLLRWTSGRNAGQMSEVKSYAAGQFILWRPTQYPIQVGDEYEARPGCDKTPETCKTKFSNFVNYGGFPDVPGRDAISKTPDSKG